MVGSLSYDFYSILQTITARRSLDPPLVAVIVFGGGLKKSYDDCHVLGDLLAFSVL